MREAVVVVGCPLVALVGWWLEGWWVRGLLLTG